MRFIPLFVVREHLHKHVMLVKVTAVLSTVRILRVWRFIIEILLRNVGAHCLQYFLAINHSNVPVVL